MVSDDVNQFNIFDLNVISKFKSLFGWVFFNLSLKEMLRKVVWCVVWMLRALEMIQLNTSVKTKTDIDIYKKIIFLFLFVLPLVCSREIWFHSQKQYKFNFAKLFSWIWWLDWSSKLNEIIEDQENFPHSQYLRLQPKLDQISFRQFQAN